MTRGNFLIASDIPIDVARAPCALTSRFALEARLQRRNGGVRQQHHNFARIARSSGLDIALSWVGYLWRLLFKGRHFSRRNRRRNDFNIKVA